MYSALNQQRKELQQLTMVSGLRTVSARNRQLSKQQVKEQFVEIVTSLPVGLYTWSRVGVICVEEISAYGLKKTAARHKEIHDGESRYLLSVLGVNSQQNSGGQPIRRADRQWRK